MIPVLVVLLLVLAVGLLWLAGRQKKATGLPGGRIIYTDTRAWGAVEKPLYDSQLGLTGKPDYLVNQGEAIIPVEVKSSRAPAEPYDSHIFQLAAYCWLVEKTYDRRPPYGILHYSGRTFAIDYTAQLEAALKENIAQIRIQERYGEADRSHNLPERCSRCSYRSHCDQRLA
jgi:CRISPR-associated exonuclease Cas4